MRVIFLYKINASALILTAVSVNVMCLLQGEKGPPGFAGMLGKAGDKVCVGYMLQR